MLFKKLLIVIVAVIVGFIAFATFRAVKFYHSITSNTTTTKNHAVKADKTQYNILLMGYGGPGHDGPYLTDTIMVAHVDLVKKTALLISIPRDLWVTVPTKSGADFKQKINGVYQMGIYPKTYPDVDVEQGKGGDLIKKIVTEVTGMPIDNTVFIDFSGFKQAIDVLGGIDVNVAKTFDDYTYPVDGHEDDTCGKSGTDLDDALKVATDSPEIAFPCRYEHLHFDKGPTHMNGETALKYARSRHSLQDGTDFGRAARQQKVIEAVRDKILSVGFVPKILPLIDTIQDHIKMDIDLGLLQKFIGEASHMKDYTISHLVLSDENFLKNDFSDYGGYILVPDAGQDNYDQIHAAVNAALQGRMDIATDSAALEKQASGSAK